MNASEYLENKPRSIGISPVLKLLKNSVKSKIFEKPFLSPLVPTFYVTFGCNLNCSFCDHPTKRAKQIHQLSTKETFGLLEKIKTGNDMISITGGEPLIREDIVEILQKSRDLGFRQIFFNTNAYLLDKKPEVLELVDYVSISLDDLNYERWDKTIGRKGAAKKIISNIIRASELRDKYKFKLIINSVLTPDKEFLRDFRNVLEFGKKHNIPISPGPVDVNGFYDKRFENNQEYASLLEEIIKQKKENPSSIFASKIYLNQIKDFSRHDCFPTQTPRVFPDGSVPIPCDSLGKNAPFKYNLKDYNSLNELLKDAYENEGLPSCVRGSKKCFMPCHMTSTNAAKFPIQSLCEFLD